MKPVYFKRTSQRNSGSFFLNELKREKAQFLTEEKQMSQIIDEIHSLLKVNGPLTIEEITYRSPSSIERRTVQITLNSLKEKDVVENKEGLWFLSKKEIDTICFFSGRTKWLNKITVSMAMEIIEENDDNQISILADFLSDSGANEDLVALCRINPYGKYILNWIASYNL